MMVDDQPSSLRGAQRRGNPGAANSVLTVAGLLRRNGGLL